MTKIKVVYVKTNLDEIEQDVNNELEALQVNKKVTITKINTEVMGTSALVQIVYNIDEEPEPQILLESEEL